MYIGYIYKITNRLNSKSYIGKTIDLNRRFAQHCSGRDCTKVLNNAIKKYGKDNFTFECLESITGNSLKELNTILNDRECHFISKYNTFRVGYNCTLGGDGLCGVSPSNETKIKISNSLKGHTDSIETRQKKSISRLGKKMSDNSKERCREAFRNRSVESEKYRKQKIKEALEGKLRDKDVVDRIAIKHKKAVLQFDLNGNLIREYDSVTSIKVPSPSNISSCCKGKSKTAYGYVWMYKIRKEENNG